MDMNRFDRSHAWIVIKLQMVHTEVHSCLIIFAVKVSETRKTAGVKSRRKLNNYFLLICMFLGVG